MLASEQPVVNTAFVFVEPEHIHSAVVVVIAGQSLGYLYYLFVDINPDTTFAVEL